MKQAKHLYYFEQGLTPNGKTINDTLQRLIKPSTGTEYNGGELAPSIKHASLGPEQTGTQHNVTGTHEQIAVFAMIYDGNWLNLSRFVPAIGYVP